jgi:hypothetical protein
VFPFSICSIPLAEAVQTGFPGTLLPTQSSTFEALRYHVRGSTRILLANEDVGNSFPSSQERPRLDQRSDYRTNSTPSIRADVNTVKKTPQRKQDHAHIPCNLLPLKIPLSTVSAISGSFDREGQDLLTSKPAPQSRGCCTNDTISEIKLRKDRYAILRHQIENNSGSRRKASISDPSSCR